MALFIIPQPGEWVFERCTRSVTGWAALIEADGASVLADCGLLPRFKKAGFPGRFHCTANRCESCVFVHSINYNA